MPSVRPTRTIDARGLVVMPGGVDMHCHIAGAAANAARLITPEQRRGEANVVPRTATHAQRHARARAQHVRHRATSTPASATRPRSTPPSPPLGARHAHHELADTPCLDKGFFVLVGNNHYAHAVHRARRPRAAADVPRVAARRRAGRTRRRS